jgi:hypothetical protein
MAKWSPYKKSVTSNVGYQTFGCSICCRETAVAENCGLRVWVPALLGPFDTQYYLAAIRFDLVSRAGWKQENRSTPSQPAAVLFRGRKKKHGVNLASNTACLSTRCHCGLGRHPWNWTDPPD